MYRASSTNKQDKSNILFPNRGCTNWILGKENERRHQSAEGAFLKSVGEL